MMLSCITVDDEPHALRLVEAYITKTPFLSLKGSYTSSVKALAALQEQEVDVVFLDINMPDLSGMQLSKLLPASTRVIFTTAYEEYALESYRVSALDYLVKPFNYAEFLAAAQKAQAYYQLTAQSPTTPEAPAYLFVKADYKYHKIDFDRILFIENIKDYVKFHLETDQRVMTLMSLKSLEERLPSPTFMKVHRSYIVNLEKVSLVERHHILFSSHRVPISEPYREQFQRFLTQK